MDIQKIINEVVEKLMKDESLLKDFNSNPVKVLEKLTGLDLPDDKVNAIIEGIRAKIKMDDVLDVAGKLMGFLGKK